MDNRFKILTRKTKIFFYLFFSLTLIICGMTLIFCNNSFNFGQTQTFNIVEAGIRTYKFYTKGSGSVSSSSVQYNTAMFSDVRTNGNKVQFRDSLDGEWTTVCTATPSSGKSFVRWDVSGVNYTAVFSDGDSGNYVLTVKSNPSSYGYVAIGYYVGPRPYYLTDFDTTISRTFSSGTKIGITNYTLGTIDYTLEYSGNWELGGGYKGVFSSWSRTGTFTLTSNTTVTAYFTKSPIDYTIEYDTNDGDYSISYTTYNVESTSSLPTPSKTGYDFAGWKPTSNSGTWSSSKTYYDGTSLKGKYGNVTLKAQWSKKYYTIDFEKFGGTGGQDSIGVYYGDKLPTLSSLPTKQGFIFDGYYTMMNRYGSHMGSQVYDSSGKMLYDYGYNGGFGGYDVSSVLYANWIPDYKLITYETDGGSLDIRYDYKTTNAIKMFSVNNYYDFMYEKFGTNECFVAYILNQYGGNVHYYPILICTEVSDVSVAITQTYNGTSYTCFGKYSFTYNGTTYCCTRANDFSATVSEQSSYFRYIATSYIGFVPNIFIDNYSSSSSDESQLIIDSAKLILKSEVVMNNSSTKLPLPTKQGYIFEGWYADDTLVGMNGETYSPSTDGIVLTAHWRKKPVVANDWFAKLNTGYSGTLTSKTMVKSISFVVDNLPTGVVDVSDANYPETVYAKFDSNTGAVTFYTNLGNIYVENTNSFFAGFSNVTQFSNINKLNTSESTDMSYMFQNCSKITSLNLSSFDTSNVTKMNYMFYGCDLLSSLNISNFYTEYVTDMSYMFYLCNSLTGINLSFFNTSNVTNMNSMFYSCSKIKTLNINSFDMTKVTNVSNMLTDCYSLLELNTPRSYNSNYTPVLPDGITFFNKTTNPNNSHDTNVYNAANKNMPVNKTICRAFTITLNSNSGTSRTTSFVAVYGSSMYRKSMTDGTVIYSNDSNNLMTTLNITNPSRRGYDFDGFTISNTTLKIITYDKRLNAHTSYVSSSKIWTYAGDLTIYAQWNVQTYNITYKDQDDYSFSGVHEDDYPTTHTYDTETPLKNASRRGSTFEGWHINPDCSDSSITSLSATGYISDITLYAKWTLNTYAINYRDRNNMPFSGIHEDGYPETHTYNTATDLKSASKVGYTFGGWHFREDCSDTIVTKLSATGFISDITLYALWNPITYSIQYKDQENKAFSGVHEDGYPTTHTYDTETSLLSATKTGYAFGGWHLDSDCLDEAVTILSAKGFTENIVLFAEWIANEIELPLMSNYQITFRTFETKDFVGATNGTGSYEYEITDSGGLEGIFVNQNCQFYGTTNSDVNTYYLKLKATDKNSHKEVEQIYTFVVNPKTIKENMANFEKELTYNGLYQEMPNVALTDGNISVDEKYYKIEGDYSEKKNAGTYTISITGLLNYTGTIQKVWVINKYTKSLSLIATKTMFEYNGSEQNPENLQVKIGDVVLPADDYELKSGYNQKNANNYTLLVNGKGNNLTSNATGTIDWKISPKEVFVAWDAYQNPYYTGEQLNIPTGSVNSGIYDEEITLSIFAHSTFSPQTNLSKVTEAGDYVAVAIITNVTNSNKNNYSLKNNEKSFSVNKANAVINKNSDINTKVLTMVDLFDYLTISNMVDPNNIKISLKSQSSNEIDFNRNASKLTISALPVNNDNVQNISFTLKLDATENYEYCELDIVIFVEKYTSTLEWVDFENYTYGDQNKKITANASSEKGVCGQIKYYSENQDVALISLTEGNLTILNAGETKIVANSPSTQTVKQNEIYRYLTINKKALQKPAKVEKTYVYNGHEQTLDITGFDPLTMEIVDNKKTNAGNYIAVVKISDKSNYVWNDDDNKNIEFEWKIEKRIIKIPIVDVTSFVYSGEIITLDIENLDDQYIEDVEVIKIHNNQARNAGKYTLIFKLVDTYNNKWQSGDESSPIETEWKIEQKEINIDAYSFTYKLNPEIKNEKFVYKRNIFRTNTKNETVGIEYRFNSNSIGNHVFGTDFEIALFQTNDGYLTTNYKINEVGNATITSFSIATPIAGTTRFVYNGYGQVVEFDNYDDFSEQTTITIKQNNNQIDEAVDVGQYIAEVSIKNPNLTWTDQTIAPKSFIFEIIRQKTTYEPMILQSEFVYSPEGNEVKIINVAPYMELSGDLFSTNVGDYVATVTITNSNYCFVENGSSINTMNLEWKITKQKITKPKLNNQFGNYNIYTGKIINMLDYMSFYDESNQNVYIDNVNYTYSATDVGSYQSKFAISNTNNYYWEDESTEPLIIDWSITKQKIASPSVISTKTFAYSGETVGLQFSEYNINLISITGNEGINVNEYTATISLLDKNNYQWLENESTDDIYINWSIERAKVNKPKIVGDYEFNQGQQIVAEFDKEIDENIIEITNNIQENAGNYEIIIKLKDNENYIWSDNTNSQIVIEWTIKKSTIERPQIIQTTFEYDGSEKSIELNDSDMFEFDTESTTNAINAGTYQAKVKISSNYENNYMFDNGENQEDMVWTIKKKSLIAPEVSKKSFTYDGKVHQAELVGFDAATMQIAGEASGTNIKFYKFSVELIDTNNYQWEDGTNSPISYSWSIVNSNGPLVTIMSISIGVTVALGAATTIFLIRKRKKKIFKIKNVSDE